MSEKRKISGEAILERINFLTEAAKVAALDENLVDLAQYLGSEADLTAKRSNVRTKPKRVLCNKCHTPLIMDSTAEVSVGPQFIVYKCKNCGNTKKCFQKDREMKRKEHKITKFEVAPKNSKN